MAFDKFIPVEQKLNQLSAKLETIISDLDKMLLKEDLLVTPVFGEAVQTEPTPPQEPSDDPS